MANSGWISDYVSRYEEDLNSYRKALEASNQSGRSSLVSSLYGQGIRGGGMLKGTQEMNRQANENMAGLARKQSDIQMQGAQGTEAVNKFNQIGAMTAQYQDLINQATKMRRGAEDQIFDTGAGGRATELENQARNLHAQITAAYGGLQGMDITNPFMGQQIAGAGAQANQFNQAATSAENNISSGKTIWNTISPLLASFLLPQLGGWLQGAGKAMGAANAGAGMLSGTAAQATGQLGNLSAGMGGMSAAPTLLGGAAQAASPWASLMQGVGNAALGAGNFIGDMGQNINNAQGAFGAQMGIGQQPLNDALMQSAMGANPQEIMQNMVKKSINNKLQEQQEAKYGVPTTVKIDEKGNVTTEYTPGGNIKDLPKLSAGSNVKSGDIDAKDVARYANVDPREPNREPAPVPGATWIKTNRNSQPVYAAVKNASVSKLRSPLSEEQSLEQKQNAQKLGMTLKEAPEGTPTTKTMVLSDGKTYFAIPKPPTQAEISRALSSKDDAILKAVIPDIANMGLAAQNGSKTIVLNGKEIPVPTFEEAKNFVMTHKYGSKVMHSLLYATAQAYGKQDEAAKQLAALTAMIQAANNVPKE